MPEENIHSPPLMMQSLLPAKEAQLSKKKFAELLQEWRERAAETESGGKYKLNFPADMRDDFYFDRSQLIKISALILAADAKVASLSLAKTALSLELFTVFEPVKPKLNEMKFSYQLSDIDFIKGKKFSKDIVLSTVLDNRTTVVVKDGTGEIGVTSSLSYGEEFKEKTRKSLNKDKVIENLNRFKYDLINILKNNNNLLVELNSIKQRLSSVPSQSYKIFCLDLISIKKDLKKTIENMCGKKQPFVMNIISGNSEKVIDKIIYIKRLIALDISDFEEWLRYGELTQATISSASLLNEVNKAEQLYNKFVMQFRDYVIIKKNMQDTHDQYQSLGSKELQLLGEILLNLTEDVSESYYLSKDLYAISKLVVTKKNFPDSGCGGDIKMEMLFAIFIFLLERSCEIVTSDDKKMIELLSALNGFNKFIYEFTILYQRVEGNNKTFADASNSSNLISLSDDTYTALIELMRSLANLGFTQEMMKTAVKAESAIAWDSYCSRLLEKVRTIESSESSIKIKNHIRDIENGLSDLYRQAKVNKVNIEQPISDLPIQGSHLFECIYRFVSTQPHNDISSLSLLKEDEIKDKANFNVISSYQSGETGALKCKP